MKNTLIFLVILILKTTPSVCQQKGGYESAIRNAERELQNRRYERSLTNLDDAEDLAANDKLKKEKIRALRKRVFNAIVKERFDSDSTRQLALKALVEITKAKNEAILSKNEAIASKLASSAREVLAKDKDEVTALRLAEVSTKVVNPPTSDAIRSLHDICSDSNYFPPVKTTHLIKRNAHKSESLKIIFSRNGDLFASCSKFLPTNQGYIWNVEDSIVRIWDNRTGKNFKTIQVSPYFFSDFSFSPSSQYFILRESDGKIKMWDLQNDKLVFTYTDTVNFRRSSFIFFNNEKPFLINEMMDSSLIMNDITSSSIVNSFKIDGTILKINSSDDGKFIVTLNRKYYLSIRDIEKNKTTIVDKRNRTDNIVFLTSPNNQILAISRNNIIELWDLNTMSKKVELIGHKKNISSFIFSKNSNYLLSSELSGETKLWDLTINQNIQTPELSSGSPIATSISADNRYISVFTTSNTIKVWRSVLDLLDPTKNATLNEEQRKEFGVPEWIKD